jgi:hypothetical protein
MIRSVYLHMNHSRKTILLLYYILDVILRVSQWVCWGKIFYPFNCLVNLLSCSVCSINILHSVNCTMLLHSISTENKVDYNRWWTYHFIVLHDMSSDGWSIHPCHEVLQIPADMNTKTVIIPVLTGFIWMIKCHTKRYVWRLQFSGT